MVIGTVGTPANLIIEQLVHRALASADKDNDGHLSSEEFGAFFTKLVLDLSEGMANTPQTRSIRAAADRGPLKASMPGPYLDRLRGFDLSRMESAASSFKYAFARAASQYDPADPSATQQIATEMRAQGFALHVDDQGNLFDDTEASGYYGIRPDGAWAPGWETRQKTWMWLAYNTAHPGPNGEIT